jgi:hypothetical protein
LLYISHNPVSPGVWNTLSPNAGQILVKWSRDAHSLRLRNHPGEWEKEKKRKEIVGEIEMKWK